MGNSPLNDLVVVELASVLAGPSVGMFLAELGARVIKVEHFRQGGDVTRTWKLSTESAAGDRPAYFTAVNWGKESIGVDLTTPEGREVVLDLVQRADIVLASYKPGDAAKLGMDADSLRARNPRLIYAALSAYGEDDPRSGFDAIIQAEAGFTYMNGHPEGGPVKMPVALMDLLAAHQLKEGILLALLRRFQTGEGATVTTTLIGAGLAALANQATNWLVGGKVPQRIGSEHPNIVPYGTIYPTRDGKAIVLAVGSDAQFRKLCTALSLPTLPDDPDFTTNPNRVTYRERLNALLSAAIAQFDREPLLATLHAMGVPAGAVREMADALSQDGAIPLLVEGDGLKALRTIAFSTDHAPLQALSPPPHLCAHTHAVLHDFLSYPEERIAALATSGAIRLNFPHGHP